MYYLYDAEMAPRDPKSASHGGFAVLLVESHEFTRSSRAAAKTLSPDSRLLGPYRLIHMAFLMSTFCSSLQARFRFARYVNPSYKKLVIKSIFCSVCVRVMVFVHSVPACPSGTAPSRLPTCTPATAPVGALLGRKCEGPSNSTAHVRVLLLLSPPILRPLSCTIMLMEYPDFGQRTSTRYAYLHRQPLYVHA